MIDFMLCTNYWFDKSPVGQPLLQEVISCCFVSLSQNMENNFACDGITISWFKKSALSSKIGFQCHCFLNSPITLYIILITQNSRIIRHSQFNYYSSTLIMEILFISGHNYYLDIWKVHNSTPALLALQIQRLVLLLTCLPQKLARNWNYTEMDAHGQVLIFTSQQCYWTPLHISMTIVFFFY